MPNLIGDPSRGLSLSLRALEPTDYALPELWNTPFQVLLDNDAALDSRVSALEGGLGSTSAALEVHRTATPLDHPDGSVTTQKLADGSVTGEKIAPNSIPLDRLEGGGVPYDLLIYTPGYILGGQTLARLVLPRSVFLATSGHIVSCDAAPAANWSAAIQRNGTQIGTVSIPAGSTTGAISLTTYSLAAGDTLTIVAQATTDSNLQGVAITLKGVA